MQRHVFAVIALLALAAPLYFVGSSRTGFQGTDELRYGQIAKELGPGKDLFLLTFNGVRYSDKPPPYFWSVALSYKIFGGVSPQALRIPGQLSGVICVVLTYILGVMLFGNLRVAALGALLFMLAPRFIWILRWGRLDVMMCVFVYAALICFWRTYASGRGRLGGWGFWGFLGLSCAIKGPAGPVVLLGSVVTFLFWQGERRRVREVFAIGPVGLAIGINLAWILPMILLGDSASSSDLLVRQNLGRVINPWRHIRPPWYYLTNTWYEALPSSFFLGGGAIYWWRRRKGKQGGADGGAEPVFGKDQTACRFLMSWLLFTLVFFSLYLPKRPQYLLPMYPAITLFSAYFIDLMTRRASGGLAGSGGKKPSRAYLLAPALINMIPIALIALVFAWRVEIANAVVAFLEPRDLEMAESLREANADFEFAAYHVPVAGRILATFLIGGVIAGFGFGVAKRRERLSLGLLLATVYGVFFSLFAFAVPPSFEDGDMRAFAEAAELRIAAQPDTVVAMYGDDKPMFNIYGDFMVHYYDKDLDAEFEAFVAEQRALGLPLVLIIETKRQSAFHKLEWHDALRRRELTVRGDSYTIFETDPEGAARGGGL